MAVLRRRGRPGLREHGYVEGRNLTVVRRYGELQGNRIDGFAAEPNAVKLDAIVTSCTGTTKRTDCRLSPDHLLSAARVA